MKRISSSLIVLAFFGFTYLSLGKGLPVDLSSYTKYKSYKIKGVNFVVHKSLYKNEHAVQEALLYWSHTLSRIERISPDTVSHFKKNKYKLYLYYLPSSRGGMEFIRDNQRSWDKRLNVYVNKGIIMPRAYAYTKIDQREAGLAYLLHEIAHYRHVVMLGESGSRRDMMIRVAYNKAMKNPLYRGTYASKNHLEYFAEASIAYLLKENTISPFPSSSRQLYEKDRVGYNLCREMWGKDAGAYSPDKGHHLASSPPKKPPVITMSPFGMAAEPPLDLPNPMPNIYANPPVVYGNGNRRTFKERTMDHLSKVYTRPSNGTVIISRQFLDIKDSLSRAETEELSGNFAMSNWIYSNSLSMLEGFKKENPYWNTSVIDNMIKRVKSKIN